MLLFLMAWSAGILAKIRPAIHFGIDVMENAVLGVLQLQITWEMFPELEVCKDNIKGCTNTSAH